MTHDLITILGLGNLLWADEGFGVRAAETLFARFQLPEQVVAALCRAITLSAAV